MHTRPFFILHDVNSAKLLVSLFAAVMDKAPTAPRPKLRRAAAVTTARDLRRRGDGAVAAVRSLVSGEAIVVRPGRGGNRHLTVDEIRRRAVK